MQGRTGDDWRGRNISNFGDLDAGALLGSHGCSGLFFIMIETKEK